MDKEKGEEEGSKMTARWGQSGQRVVLKWMVA